ncbi:hypothetical protein [Hymenobacter sp. BRD67]|uniref:hypothetical protein n=1 Tax=Hymenobacter sp. BRD67 TaxID=2675877 RepID=UPI001565E299|nr:hypothetical protein [Hymenobacter sp. BRD67]QKG53534.1 hypothetical protein GKZ67_14210 [Hymenobacter sp. BRD67]
MLSVKLLPRVLNSNLQITNVDREVAAWMASNFMPYIDLAGIRQMAWVYAPSVRGQAMAHEIMARLPNATISLFNEMSEAVAWLEQTKPAPGTASKTTGRLAAHLQIADLIRAFRLRFNL